MQYFSFQWHITDYCDQRCKHCYIFSEGHPDLLSVSVERAKKVIDSCVEMCEKMGGRLPYFYVTGGDPLLHPQVWDILGMLKAKEIPFTILGNPFHLTDENCKKLKYYGCEKYQLSIDGNRETHDFMRKPCSFDTTLEKIEVLHRNGIRAGVNEAHFLDAAKLLAERVNVPIVLVGGLRSIGKINEILNETSIAYISLSRPLIREPNLINRWQQGDTAPSKCVSCNACYGTPGHQCIFNLRANQPRQ